MPSRGVSDLVRASITFPLSSPLHIWSISYPHARAPPVIGRWLCEAYDRSGTLLIAAAPTEVEEETVRITGLAARAKFNLGTTSGFIEAARSGLGEMGPGLVSDLVHTTFMVKPTLRAVLIHLSSADVTILVAGMLPHIPKSKNKAKGREPNGRA